MYYNKKSYIRPEAEHIVMDDLCDTAGLNTSIPTSPEESDSKTGTLNFDDDLDGYDFRVFTDDE